MIYRITNTNSGTVLGDYEGETEADALDALARDAGYPDAATATRIHGPNPVILEPLRGEWVCIAGDTWPCDTDAEIAAARAELRELGVSSVPVWRGEGDDAIRTTLDLYA